MTQKIAVGQQVSFSTNFYPDLDRNEGTGKVVGFEGCRNKGSQACDCGAGGTYYVRINGSNLTGAYVGAELKVLEEAATAA